MIDLANPVGLRGIDFVEFCAAQSDWLDTLFKNFGFSKLAYHSGKNASLYVQGAIRLILNDSKDGFSRDYERRHGPCISSMGWRVRNARDAMAAAVARGATAAQNTDFRIGDRAVPAIYGIGESLLYFIDDELSGNLLEPLGFERIVAPDFQKDLGFACIDHLTNNVGKGEMQHWASFYKDIFGFTEVRYFDIKGKHTGLTSYALQSPDKSFCIPINEGSDDKSQINEYLREYKGPGVQHIAFLTKDILSTLDGLRKSSVQTLEIDAEYYQSVFKRVPHVKEDHDRIRQHNVLVDGDEEGYLLQIFTKNVVGPIFIEIIQRENHKSFGEGNFEALFRSIERDQEARGVLRD